MRVPPPYTVRLTLSSLNLRCARRLQPSALCETPYPPPSRVPPVPRGAPGDARPSSYPVTASPGHPFLVICAGKGTCKHHAGRECIKHRKITRCPSKQTHPQPKKQDSVFIAKGNVLREHRRRRNRTMRAFCRTLPTSPKTHVLASGRLAVPTRVCDRAHCLLCVNAPDKH